MTIINKNLFNKFRLKVAILKIRKNTTTFAEEICIKYNPISYW